MPVHPDDRPLLDDWPTRAPRDGRVADLVRALAETGMRLEAIEETLRLTLERKLAEVRAAPGVAEPGAAFVDETAERAYPYLDDFEGGDEPGVFDEIEEEHERRLDAEAEADIAAGRVVSHEAMVRWMRSWGTENELPPPKCGE